MAARRYEIFLLVLKNISLFRWFFNTRREFRIFKRPCNVLFIIFTPMKCQTISLEYFFAAERRYILCTHRRGTLGVPSAAIPWKIGKYRNTVPKMDEILNTNTFIQLYPSRVFVYLKHVGTRNQTQTFGRKREKTLIGRKIEMPGYWMPFQFRHRLCNHLPLSLKS